MFSPKQQKYVNPPQFQRKCEEVLGPLSFAESDVVAGVDSHFQNGLLKVESKFTKLVQSFRWVMQTELVVSKTVTGMFNCEISVRKWPYLSVLYSDHAA